VAIALGGESSKSSKAQDWTIPFDAPNGEYSVLYGNKDRFGCFAEVYGDSGRITREQAARKLSFIESTKPLQLVPLDHAPTQKCFHLDGRINMSKQYHVTQLWSQRLHAWFPQADGIRYLSRHAGTEHNYCLFLDRCASALEVMTHAEIQYQRNTVLFAAERYNLTVYLAKPDTKPAW
jgi:hypothetical protein